MNDVERNAINRRKNMIKNRFIPILPPWVLVLMTELPDACSPGCLFSRMAMLPGECAPEINSVYTSIATFIDTCSESVLKSMDIKCESLFVMRRNRPYSAYRSDQWKYIRGL